MVRISLFIYVLFSSFGVMNIFFPLYLKSKGLDSGQIGNLYALGAFVSIFAQPLWGFVSDKTKTIKRVLQMLIISSLLLSIGLFSVKTYVFILLLYVGFMLFYCSVGPLTETLCLAYAYENKKDFGKIRMWGEVGVGTSSILLGVIVERIGIQSLWMVYAVIILLSIFASFWVRDTKASTTPVNFKALRKVMTQPKLLWFLFLILLLAIPNRMNDSMLGIYLSDLHATETQLGFAWLVATLCTAVALLFVGNLLKKWNELVIFIFAGFMYVIRWVIYSQADNPYVLVAAQALHSLTFPLLLVASLQYILKIVPAELKATGQAAFAVTFGGLGMIIGSSVGGHIFEQFGPQTAYGAGSVLALIGTIAAVLTYVKERKSIVRRSHSPGTHIR